MTTIQEEQKAADKFFKGKKKNPKFRKKPTHYNALTEIIDICDEERVFEQGQLSDMLEDKINEIRTKAEQYIEDIRKIHDYCP